MYLGGHAGLVEGCLGVDGDQVLYVGDHIFSDVHVSKNIQRWRTALVLREIEKEIEAIEAFEGKRMELERLMVEKERLEREGYELRLTLQRLKHGYGDAEGDPDGLRAELEKNRAQLQDLDGRIQPLAITADEMNNNHWGLLMRAGNDKSHYARQVEQYADIYMSRVSSFIDATPFAYLRSARGTLPHDPHPVPEERFPEVA